MRVFLIALFFSFSAFGASIGGPGIGSGGGGGTPNVDTVTGTLAVANGGTGQTSATAAADALLPTTTQGDTIYHNGTDNVRLAKDASATRYMSNTGTDNNPAWAQVNLANGVSGALPIANGGTGTVGGAPTTIFKTSEAQKKNSSDVLADDDTLTFAVAANKTYNFKIVAHFVSNTTADVKFALTGPASPTRVTFTPWIASTSAVALFVQLDTAFGTSRGWSSYPASDGTIIIEGVFTNGANAGNVTLQWAQNTSTAVDTYVKIGSFLQYQQTQ